MIYKLFFGSLGLLLCSFLSFAKQDEKGITIYLDNPIVKSKKIKQNITIISPSKQPATYVYKIELLTNAADVLYSKSDKVVMDSQKCLYDIEWTSSGFKSISLFDIYKSYEMFPITDTLSMRFTLHDDVDTFIVYKKVQNEKWSGHNALTKDFISYYEKHNDGKMYDLYYGKFAKSYFKKKGLDVVIENSKDKRTLYLYHEKTLLLFFEHYKQLKTLGRSAMDLSFDNVTFNTKSQKEIITKEQKTRGLDGEIYTRAQVSTAKESLSSIDNNYYELGGTLNIPIMGLPFMVNGMYTSQDKGRQFKSSYIDINFNKDLFAEQLESYNEVYNENIEKFKTIKSNTNRNFMESVSQLEAKKDKISSELKNEISILIVSARDTLTTKVDTATIPYNKLVAIYNNPYAAGMDEIESWVCEKCDSAYQKRLLKITKLLNDLNQLRKSAEVIKSKYDQFQIKQLVDSVQMNEYLDKYNLKNKGFSETIPMVVDKLPNNKLKKFVSKITNFDVGMLSNYHSDYTLSGQMTKGLDVGYDFGLLAVGGNIGFVDYLTSDGTVLKYKTGLGKVVMEPNKSSKMQLSYFTYAPLTHQPALSISSSGVKYSGLSSKIDPTAIFSFLYHAQFDRLNWKIDYSQSKAGNRSLNTNNLKNSSFNTGVEFGYIPHNDISVVFEHIGSDFENKVLPFMLNGTQKIKIQSLGTYFRNKLRLKLDYQLLTQRSLAYNGKNTKWGFEIGTNFKNSPNVTLAYKPFSTFRTLTDTFQIQQRPMMGDVFLFKSSFSFKGVNHSTYNFNAIINHNSSSIDTSKYESTNCQLMMTYNDKLLMFQGILGYVKSSGDGYNTAEESNKLLFNNYFETFQVVAKLNPDLTLGGGFDVAHNENKIIKTGLNLSSAVAFRKWPIKAMVTARWINYSKELVTEQTAVAVFEIGLNYTFLNKSK